MKTMREIINLMEATTISFHLPERLDSTKYQITNSLKDLKTWKANIYLANNGYEKKVGEFDNVGYVWVSTVDNTIIPIAQNDEHHAGGDLVYYLIRKYKLQIDPKNYVPVFYSMNYIYKDSQIKSWLIVARKWLKWGGNDSILSGAYSSEGLMTNFSSLVRSRGNTKIAPGTLAPLGKQFYDIHKKLSEIFIAAISSRRHGPAFATAAQMFEYYDSELPIFLKNTKLLIELRKKFAQMRRADDINGLNELFFGFDSIKQQIHVQLKQIRDELAAGKDPLWSDKWRGFWGDLNLAANMLTDL